MTKRNKKYDPKDKRPLKYDDYLKNNRHILCIECRKADGIQMCLSGCNVNRK